MTTNVKPISLSELAGSVEKLDAEIVKCKESINYHDAALTHDKQKLVNLDYDRRTLAAKIAIKLGIVKSPMNKAGAVVAQAGPLNEEQVRQADEAIAEVEQAIREMEVPAR